MCNFYGFKLGEIGESAVVDFVQFVQILQHNNMLSIVKGKSIK